MLQQKERQPVPSYPWWMHLNSLLLRGLLFLWGTVGVGLALNVGTTLLTSKGFELKGTLLEWPFQHLFIVLPCCGGLLLLTVGSAIVNSRMNVTPSTNRRLLPTLQNRSVLLHLLRQEYSRQLAQSLHGTTMMQLQLQERGDIVASPARLISWHLDGSEKQILSPSTSIIEVYDHASTGLLLLGVPGAGKSTLLRELADELLTRAEKDLTHPVPVIVNLSSWSRQKLPLANWLVEQLQLVYAVPRALSQSWIEQGQLLFLLDGLDEVAAPARTDCIREINRYREAHFIPLVVCSRSHEYLSQKQQLKVSLAAEIQTLTVEQVNNYLKKVGPSMAAVQAALQGNDILRDLVTTPLMLSVIMLAYRGKQVEDLPQLGTVEEQQHQIFEQYVTRMLEQQTRKWYYPVHKTQRWLMWLAKQMNQRQLTEFYLELLQPGWLLTRWGFNLFPWISGLVVGLVVGLVAGSYWLVNIAFLLITAPDYMYVDYSSKLAVLPDIILAFGLVGALLGVLIIGQESSKIEPVEKVGWSWKQLLEPLIGSINRLVVVLVIVVVFALVTELLNGLVFGLIVGIVGGLTTTQLDGYTRIEPNQGIYASGKNALRIGLVGGLASNLAVGLVNGLVNDLVAGSFVSLFYWLFIGLAAGLVGGLYFGGLAYVRHYILRLSLWCSGIIPWNYVRFLNEVTDRVLLQRVSGGYRFIHPLFQEYFASLDTQARIGDRHPQQSSSS